MASQDDSGSWAVGPRERRGRGVAVGWEGAGAGWHLRPSLRDKQEPFNFTCVLRSGKSTGRGEII